MISAVNPNSALSITKSAKSMIPILQSNQLSST